jgi:hypothetical protein
VQLSTAVRFGDGTRVTFGHQLVFITVHEQQWPRR